MHKRIRYSMIFHWIFFFVLAMSPACMPNSDATQIQSLTEAASPTFVPIRESPTAVDTDVTTGGLEWSMYTLEAELPDSPKQMSLYTQAIPTALPDEQRLTEIMEQLQITGMVSTNTGEAGETILSVTGDSGSFSLVSDDPFLLTIENTPHIQESDATAVILSPEVRAQAAEEFLNVRGLLDFPHLIEPPRMSRDRDHAIRIVPLIDGYPLYDYDPLNGRLLVWFNPVGEISVIFWRPLKLTAGEAVNIVPAAVAWDQLVRGDLPEGEAPGQCWQATVFDSNEPYGVAAPLNSTACVSFGSGPTQSYKSATINEVRLVYFAHDLSLGMSPFAFPADSPARIVFPMWQFSGITDDGRELIVLWPATQAP